MCKFKFKKWVCMSKETVDILSKMKCIHVYHMLNVTLDMSGVQDYLYD